MTRAVGSGQVVDTPSALEFMQEVMRKVTVADLAVIASETGVKSQRFQAVLAPEALRVLDDEGYRRLLRSIFATRRRAGEIQRALPVARFRDAVAALLYAHESLESRFQAFYEQAFGATGSAACDLASELLHYSFPARYWLWTKWMWDPGPQTGALRLVTMDEFDLARPTAGATYMRVGEAVAFVHSTGEAVGFTRHGEGLSGTHIYLACVYVIYMYTVLRIRMTQEFNQVVPPLPELCRRLLGVYRLEV